MCGSASFGDNFHFYCLTHFASKSISPATTNFKARQLHPYKLGSFYLFLLWPQRLCNISRDSVFTPSTAVVHYCQWFSKSELRFLRILWLRFNSFLLVPVLFWNFIELLDWLLIFRSQIGLQLWKLSSSIFMPCQGKRIQNSWSKQLTSQHVFVTFYNFIFQTWLNKTTWRNFQKLGEITLVAYFLLVFVAVSNGIWSVKISSRRKIHSSIASDQWCIIFNWLRHQNIYSSSFFSIFLISSFTSRKEILKLAANN